MPNTDISFPKESYHFKPFSILPSAFSELRDAINGGDNSEIRTILETVAILVAKVIRLPYGLRPARSEFFTRIGPMEHRKALSLWETILERARAILEDDISGSMGVSIYET